MAVPLNVWTGTEWEMTGAYGVDGVDGADGLGVPAGGTTDQVLAKASNADNDTAWVDATGSGSSTGSDLYLAANYI